MEVFLIAVSYHSKVAQGGWVGYPSGYPTPLVSDHWKKGPVEKPVTC